MTCNLHISSYFNNVVDNCKDNYDYISTCNDIIDSLIGGGLLHKELVTFVGTSSSMVEFLLYSLAANMTILGNISTAIIPTDTDSDLIAKMILCAKNGVLRQDFWSSVTQTYKESRDRIAKEFDSVPLYISSQNLMSLNEIKEAIRSMVKENNVKVFFLPTIDKLTEFKHEDNTIARTLKILCRELNITIITCMCPNWRYFDKEGGYHECCPNIRDISDNGGFDAFSDFVIGIERPECYQIYENEKGESLKDTINLDIIKSRSGDVSCSKRLTIGQCLLDFKDERGNSVIPQKIEETANISFKYDPIEDTFNYIQIKDVVEKELDDMLKDYSSYNQFGFCHIYWKHKKELLKTKYGIEWKSPAEMNPDICFD